jgi:UDP-N-acetylglucosamine 2-epimerase (non-hydrolysing)
MNLVLRKNMESSFFIISGTRPEVIKLFPVYQELKKRNINVCWVAAGQHDSLQKQALDFFNIIPNYHLPILEVCSLSDLVGKLIIQLSELFLKTNPLAVIVQGDTATTLAASMAAYFLKIKVIYLEAGLRSFDLNAPFPEEANRQIVSRISDLLFSPTDLEKENLIAEKIGKNKILVVGNTVVDALCFVQNQFKMSKIFASDSVSKIVSDLKMKKQKLALFTMHRREALDGLANSILGYIPELINKLEQLNAVMIYLKHPNPRFSFLSDFFLRPEFADKIIILEPLDYKDTVFLLSNSEFILSDSGGLLEEAVSLNKPVVCLREKSERFFSGLKEYVFLAGDKGSNFLSSVDQAILLLSRKKKIISNPFGDGQAAIKIVNVMQKFFKDSMINE